MPGLELVGYQPQDILAEAMMTKDALEVARIRAMGKVTTTVAAHRPFPQRACGETKSCWRGLHDPHHWPGNEITLPLAGRIGCRQPEDHLRHRP